MKYKIHESFKYTEAKCLPPIKNTALKLLHLTHFVSTKHAILVVWTCACVGQSRAEASKTRKLEPQSTHMKTRQLWNHWKEKTHMKYFDNTRWKHEMENCQDISGLTQIRTRTYSFMTEAQALLRESRGRGELPKREREKGSSGGTAITRVGESAYSHIATAHVPV